ncbi:MAG TPA: glucokinase, partial [Thermoanaerobaculia bacterium]
ILARGGVYLAGGVAAKNRKFFTDGRFVDAFLRKGRFTEMLREMPIDLIIDEKVGLRGAAEMARRIASLKRPQWD